MAIHTTNYYDTFIQVAEDCPALAGEIPPQKGDAKSIASIQYELIGSNPYQYTSDDILFEVYALRNEIADGERAAQRQQLFSKGQACLRSSPLAKRYGWGIHSNAEGKVAVFGLGSADYERLAEDKNIRQLRAMRSSRK